MSILTKPEKLQDAIEKLQEASAINREPYKDKREDYRFRAGHMWTAEEKRILGSKKPPRPAYVWNFIQPCVNLTVGTIIQNPFKTIPEPREESDQLLCDILHEALEFVDDKIGADNEEIEAFEDSATCGDGYIDVDVVSDPKRPTEILMAEMVVPFHEAHWDPASRRDDRKDARWVFREKWLSLEDFKITYPKYAAKVEKWLDEGKLTVFSELKSEAPTIEGVLVDDAPDSDYGRPLSPAFYNTDKKLVRVVRMQYWESFQRYYGFNPTTGEVEEFPKDKLDALKERLPDFEYTKIWDKKVKWLEFFGDEIIYDDDSPIPYDGFSLVPMYWTKDKSQEYIDHYGIVRALKDPNREVNKRWCQALNSLVSQGQGVMAEIDAFVDIAQAEGSWTDPTEITWLNKGALQQKKVLEKPAQTFPDGPMKMEAMAQDAIKTISGFNPNLTGEVGSKQESGVVIRLRIQQGLTLLARAFDNYKKMRTEVTKRKMAIILEYMPESQLLRILGGNEKYQIQDGIIHDVKRGISTELRNIKDLKYNVKIEDAPGNITKTMAELAIFLEMMKQGFPVNPETVINKLDLSAGEKADWLEFVRAGKEQQGQAVQAQAQKELEEQQGKLQIESDKLAVKREENLQDFAVNVANLDQNERMAAQKVMADFFKQGQAAQQKMQQGQSQQQGLPQQGMSMPMTPRRPGGNGRGRQPPSRAPRPSQQQGFGSRPPETNRPMPRRRPPMQQQGARMPVR